jgi:hypothetical protein
MSTAVTVPSNIITACDLNAGWSMFDTDNSSAGNGWVEEGDNVYFTTSSSFSSAYSSGTKLTIDNLCKNAGKTIYLLFDPHAMNSSFNPAYWKVQLNGTIDFSTRTYVAGQGSIYQGSERVKYPSHNGLFYSAVYLGNMRIFHSEVFTASVKPSSGFQGLDGLMSCPANTSYTFSDYLKPYDVEVECLSSNFKPNSLSVSYSPFTGKVTINGTATTQNQITYNIRGLYAW